jgi:LPXTG-motif cell wall-anchored protein
MVILTVAAALGLFAAAPAQSAGASNGVYQAQQLRSVTIPAGGSATLTVRGFCLEFGEPFPTGDTTARGAAVDRVRSALNYAVQRGYTEGNAAQVQLAIWYLSDNTWRSEDRTIAQEIVDNATTANLPTQTGDGTSLADAVASNTVTVTARFVPQTADAFYGDGTAEVRNLTNAEVRIYMPIGVVFRATGGDQFQDLVAYELAVQAQPTGTTAATSQPTSQPTITAVTTPAATGTAGTETPTAGATATVEATGTVSVATAEATATIADTTPTVEATVAVETPTTVAVDTPTVELPTATVEPLPTLAPLPTDTPLATGGGTLPQTGEGDVTIIVLALMALGAAFTGFGLLARRAQKRV